MGKASCAMIESGFQMRLPKSVVPNSITLLSVLVGFAAVTRAMQGDFLVAAWVLCFAAFLDTLDGRVAA